MIRKDWILRKEDEESEEWTVIDDHLFHWEKVKGKKNKEDWFQQNKNGLRETEKTASKGLLKLTKTDGSYEFIDVENLEKITDLFTIEKDENICAVSNYSGEAIAIFYKDGSIKLIDKGGKEIKKIDGNQKFTNEKEEEELEAPSAITNFSKGNLVMYYKNSNKYFSLSDKGDIKELNIYEPGIYPQINEGSYNEGKLKVKFNEKDKKIAYIEDDGLFELNMKDGSDRQKFKRCCQAMAYNYKYIAKMPCEIVVEKFNTIRFRRAIRKAINKLEREVKKTSAYKEASDDGKRNAAQKALIEAKNFIAKIKKKKEEEYENQDKEPSFWEKIKNFWGEKIQPLLKKDEIWSQPKSEVFKDYKIFGKPKQKTQDNDNERTKATQETPIKIYTKPLENTDTKEGTPPTENTDTKEDTPPTENTDTKEDSDNLDKGKGM